MAPMNKSHNSELGKMGLSWHNLSQSTSNVVESVPGRGNRLEILGSSNFLSYFCFIKQSRGRIMFIKKNKKVK